MPNRQPLRKCEYMFQSHPTHQTALRSAGLAPMSWCHCCCSQASGDKGRHYIYKYIALCKPLKVNINSNTYRRETYDLTHGYLALHPIMIRIAFLSFEMSTTAPKFLMLKTPSRFLFFFLPFLDSGCLSGSRTKQRGLSDDSCQESPEAVRV